MLAGHSLLSEKVEVHLQPLDLCPESQGLTASTENMLRGTPTLLAQVCQSMKVAQLTPKAKSGFVGI